MGEGKLEVVVEEQMVCGQRHFEQPVLLMRVCVHWWVVDLEAAGASIDLEARAAQKQGVAGVERMELRTEGVVEELMV
jgi:hypothetical protein